MYIKSSCMCTQRKVLNSIHIYIFEVKNTILNSSKSNDINTTMYKKKKTHYPKFKKKSLA